ncbi:cytochrome P450 [Streptomyces sp. TLI_171]|uniref:cytochrome P450 n=1 Tax=Streptomyces sp. TLI_171 TaxID=1938859 RepID=UPI000C1A8174|nr:cytochrome P450 [Streptomyces sp. TLI_171]RKE20179.1 cytochrome P450 [Streptomyces sp. TLI_171]
MDARPPAPAAPPAPPARPDRLPLHGPEFAADPDGHYRLLRQYGPAAPVELAPGVDATLVTDYAAALTLLQDPATFRKDPHRWRALNEGAVPPDSPVLPLLSYRPNCMFTDGIAHMRLRQAVTDSMARIDPGRLARTTRQVSDFLIGRFAHRGSADLITGYARQLPLFVFNELFGCTADIGDRVLFGISGMFDGVNAEQAAQVLFGAVGELVALKRRQPGEDVASWLMSHHHALTDEELVHQLALLLGAGAEPLGNLIGNTLHRRLTDPSYAAGDALLDEAIEDTLWENPPITNLAPHYPAVNLTIGTQRVRAGDLVLIGFAAANTGPELTAQRQTGSRAYLSWSAGPHACPSKDPALHITLAALENLFDRLPDLELAVPEASLSWRPGPFHRALSSLPVRFTPAAPAPPAPTAAPPPPAPAATTGRPGRWSQFLNRLTG